MLRAPSMRRSVTRRLRRLGRAIGTETLMKGSKVTLTWLGLGLGLGLGWWGGAGVEGGAHVARHGAHDRRAEEAFEEVGHLLRVRVRVRVRVRDRVRVRVVGEGQGCA